MSGKKAPLKRPANWRKHQDLYIEARKGGSAIRYRTWIDHNYDCTADRRWDDKRGKTKPKFKSMEPCSLFANYDRLWGESDYVGRDKWKQGRFDFSVTDNHW